MAGRRGRRRRRATRATAADARVLLRLQPACLVFVSASSTLEHITHAYGAATRPSHVQTTRLLAQDNPLSRAAVAGSLAVQGRGS